jgi:hypothetical protein
MDGRLKCNTDFKGFDDNRRCYAMEQDDQTYPTKYFLTEFNSPFWNADFLLTGQSNKDNCQCNDGQDSYCIPYADSEWISLHNFYREKIVPRIRNIPAHQYTRYDMWLQEPNSTLSRNVAIEFANKIYNIQKKYYVNENTRTCINKINPFVQQKWAIEEFVYKAAVLEDPVYF